MISGPRRTLLALFAVAGAAISLRAQPQAHPDLQGMWLNDTATPLERPASVGGKEFFTPEEAREYERRYLLDRTLAISRDKDFELNAAGDLDSYEPGHLLPGGRTSLIVDPPDGRVPALTPEALRQLTGRTQHLDLHYAENPEDLRNADRCLVVGNSSVPPMLPVFYNNTVQIVQTAGYVMILSEMVHDARIVSLARRTHLPAAVREWKGDSIGRWEGDTLVVDTTNFTDKTSLRGTSTALHVIERFTLASPDALTYRFTIDDPAFVRAWTGESRLTRTSDRMYEYACHEANYSMAGVLSGARYSERK
jgi:hypothetical protein